MVDRPVARLKAPGTKKQRPCISPEILEMEVSLSSRTIASLTPITPNPKESSKTLKAK